MSSDHSKINRTKKTKVLVILSYLAIYGIWGSTYYFIKLAVETIPPFGILAIRFTIAGSLFLCIGLIQGGKPARPSFKEVASSVLLGTLLLIFGNGLVTVAEKKVDSYLAALILACVPLVVAFYDRILVRKKISLIKVLGILIGIIGVALLLYDERSASIHINNHTFLIIIALFSWSLGTSLGHRFKVPGNTFINSGIQMLFVGMIALFYNSIFEVSIFRGYRFFSGQSIISLAYLTLFGALAFTAYTYLIKHEPAVKIVSNALVNPVIAVFIGLFIAHESVVPLLWYALPLILFGLAVMIYGDSLIKKKKR